MALWESSAEVRDRLMRLWSCRAVFKWRGRRYWAVSIWSLQCTRAISSASLLRHRPGRSIRSRIRCPRVRHTRIAHSHHLATAQIPRIRTARRRRRRPLAVRAARRLDDIRSRNRYPMRRASRTYHSPTLPAVMFPIPKTKLRPTYRTPGDISIWLPLRQYNIATISPPRETASYTSHRRSDRRAHTASQILAAPAHPLLHLRALSRRSGKIYRILPAITGRACCTPIGRPSTGEGRMVRNASALGGGAGVAALAVSGGRSVSRHSAACRAEKVEP